MVKYNVYDLTPEEEAAADKHAEWSSYDEWRRLNGIEPVGEEYTPSIEKTIGGTAMSEAAKKAPDGDRLSKLPPPPDYLDGWPGTR